MAKDIIRNFKTLKLVPKKYQKFARIYDHTGLSTKCTLIKTSFKKARTGTMAKFRPFVDALVEILILNFFSVKWFPQNMHFFIFFHVCPESRLHLLEIKKIKVFLNFFFEFYLY